MKSNKNAFRRIILSLLVIALCVSSAAGATFALFTSGGKDGALNTVITAGSVEAIIVDEQGESLVGKQLTFVCADDTREELLWEPGAKFHTQGFRVRNDGDVPMNYRMYVSGGDAYADFLDAFEFYITKDPATKNAEEKLTAFRGSLPVGKEGDIYYLVVRMREEANSDFRLRTYTGIGVTVYAVQGNVEIEE
ncbi:MAG: hypothetical protein IJX81_06375 [Clostridia bacterium]|nr:hypothetical protein [Clostridia bacterium]